MDRRIAFAAMIALTFLTSAASAGLPKRAGISYAVTGRWEKALDAIPEDTQDGAEKYFRAIALIETGRINEGLGNLSRLGGTPGAFGVAALEKIAEYAFEMGRYAYLVETVHEPVGVRMVDEEAFRYRLGMSHYLVGRPAEAKAYLEKIQAHRFKPYALHTLALIAFSEGDFPSAVELLGKALDSVQFLPDGGVRSALADRLRLVRARVIYQAGIQGRELAQEQRSKLFKLAISQLTGIKEESPYWAEAQRTIGWCSLEMLDTVRALASFQVSMGADPANAHEDLWATGRLFERLGYFEDAATAYRQAAQKTKEKAAQLKADVNAPYKPTLEMLSTGWGKLYERLGNVEWMLEEVRSQLAASVEAAQGRKERQKGLDVELSTLLGRIDGTTQELAVMTKDLYRYLDAMNLLSLFPKKDRARVSALLDRRASLDAEIAKIRASIMALEQTRSYNKATEARKRAVKVLWENLDKAGQELSEGEMAFLEGVKRRVSVREKELVALLNEKKEENEALRPRLAATVQLVAEDKKALAALSGKIASLSEKIGDIGGRLKKLRGDLDQAMVETHSAGVLRKAGELSMLSDQYTLDEVQALDRLKARKTKEGAQ